MENLNAKHRLFVEAYDGDALKACRIAGWQGGDAYLKAKGEELLTMPLIIEAIKDRSKYTAATKNAIMSRQERQALWSDIARNNDPFQKPVKDSNGIEIEVLDPNIPLATRLRASELLGKSEADFTENVQQNVNMSFDNLIQKSYQVERSIEEIEADYYKIKEAEQLPAPEVNNLEDLI